jgi:hypothetical protein
MSFKSFLQFFDAPLAIVVGGVASALIVGQLAVASMASLDDGSTAARQQSLRYQRSSLSSCLESQPQASYASCVTNTVEQTMDNAQRSVLASLNGETERSPAGRSKPAQTEGPVAFR